MPRPRKPWQPKPTAAARPVRRVMGYVRVSTTEQADAYGLDAQREAIRAYCQAAGYELVGIAEDAGLSGTLDAGQRSGLAALLDAVAAGEVDGVVVKALDRIGRRPAVATAVFEALDAAGVTFLSITEPAFRATCSAACSPALLPMSADASWSARAAAASPKRSRAATPAAACPTATAWTATARRPAGRSTRTALPSCGASSPSAPRDGPTSRSPIGSTPMASPVPPARSGRRVPPTSS